MKAIRLHEQGDPSVLRYEEVPVPTPGPGEVLIRVHAAGINPPDWYMRGGLSSMPGETTSTFRLPAIPGTDISGVVASPADGFPVDAEVFGMVRFPSFHGGGYAEYITAPVSDLARKPAGLSHVQAAGVPMAALTAWQFLIEVGHDEPNPFQPFPHRPVPLGPGMTVLVNGAAGGVGHFAVQLAAAAGARVVAVASGRHESFVRSLGASSFVDYTKEDPGDVVRDVDVVLDTVGGPAAGRLLRTVRQGGAVFPVFPGEYDAAAVAERNVVISGTQVRSSGAQLAELGRMLDAGTLVVGIDSTFLLAEAAAAHERAARGHLQGKIVLTV
ncbi:NADP-dependent oxidoreductase [Symbioplanes lichenis]|uniref:NADP-dependent oxidoreductase n=1 Tax=Symbioplanes lichenis TaxID=1629072 RepID=UPI002738B762|nr:NADP-dependent oxidoreductase [Actinoplanes lichenis]